MHDKLITNVCALMVIQWLCDTTNQRRQHVLARRVAVAPRCRWHSWRCRSSASCSARTGDARWTRPRRKSCIRSRRTRRPCVTSTAVRGRCTSASCSSAWREAFRGRTPRSTRWRRRMTSLRTPETKMWCELRYYRPLNIAKTPVQSRVRL